MSFEKTQLNHYERLADLSALFNGSLGAVLAGTDTGALTAEQAIDLIREQFTEHQAAWQLAWADYRGGGSR